MELKKDSNAVSIDMLLIVHSEKRRAAQGTHSDQQADPGTLPQRRGLHGVSNGIRGRQKLEGNGLLVVTSRDRSRCPSVDQWEAREEDGNLAEKQYPQQTQVITSYDNQGTQLTVEVHPRDTMPQLLKKFSLAKCTYVKGHSHVEGWQGGLKSANGPEPSLQGDKNGNTRPRQPGGKDAHGFLVGRAQQLTEPPCVPAYPWDRSSLKSMPLDLRHFEKLDSYASQVGKPAPLQQTSSP
ncbi:Kyphoscoliosis peptidase [Galemys pyrenaicus]|uniref:Kyphoscoliosis peptidase n=1 Tax=Galemys pyrenaicus TaxID=202257 RepID=A0A8J6A489_GALPY|nr:Kyphoscoliosis peptidase [Galemys pyrenaicus]